MRYIQFKNKNIEEIRKFLENQKDYIKIEMAECVNNSDPFFHLRDCKRSILVLDGDYIIEDDNYDISIYLEFEFERMKKEYLN